MLIVLVVISALLSIAAVMYFGARNRANVAAATGYASEVLKSAVSAVAVGADLTAVETADCSGGYALGLNPVVVPVAAIDACSVSEALGFLVVRVEAAGQLVEVP